jgi:hypothetical protein
MSIVDERLEALDRYLERYIHLHRAAAEPEGEEMAALLACYSPNARYQDMPSGRVWTGHEEIKEMCVGGYRFGDNEKHILSRYTDGRNFTFEIESIGSNLLPIGEPGARWALYACSIGSFDDDGLVAGQRDYWDRHTWQVQVGLVESVDYARMIFPEGTGTIGG